MKGMFEFTETFLKMLTTGYLAVVLLGIFFSLNNYYLYFDDTEINRDVLSFGDGLIAADCLVIKRDGYPVKALLNETAISDDEKSPSCVDYGRDFMYTILLDEKEPPIYTVGSGLDPEKTHSALFPAAMQKDSGEVVPILVNVSVVR